MGDQPTAAFHVVIAGSCWLRRHGEQPLHLGTGDVVLLPTGGGHALSSHADSPLVPYDDVRAAPGEPVATVDLNGPGPVARVICGAYHYDAHAAHPLMNLLPPILHLAAGPSVSRGPVEDTVHMLAMEITSQRPGARTVVDRLVDVLLVHIVREWLALHPDTARSWLTALDDPQVGKAVMLIHQQPGQEWTVDTLANQVGVSRATLARRFTALVGEPPMTYLTRWRLELAARRLRDTDEPLPTIATQVGYSTEFAFSRAFTRDRGTPPARYRNDHRKRHSVA
jgi:AraC-like DNA-binding protein